MLAKWLQEHFVRLHGQIESNFKVIAIHIPCSEKKEDRNNPNDWKNQLPTRRRQIQISISIKYGYMEEKKSWLTTV